MMLQQIKYAIEDIRERKLFFASYFLQILIGLLAVSFLFSSGIQLFHFGKSCFISKIWMKFTL